MIETYTSDSAIMSYMFTIICSMTGVNIERALGCDLSLQRERQDIHQTFPDP